MILNDGDILERIKKGLFSLASPESVQPASYDMMLGEEIRSIDGKLLKNFFTEDSSYVLKPGQFVLAHTIEKIDMPNDLVGIVLGKSSLARKGLQVEMAGFIDPGFVGQITLEISNLSDKPIELKFAMNVCQIYFMQLTRPAIHPYSADRNHYQYQTGATTSKSDCFIELPDPENIYIQSMHSKEEFDSILENAFTGKREEGKKSKRTVRKSGSNEVVVEGMTSIEIDQLINEIIRKILGDDDEDRKD